MPFIPQISEDVDMRRKSHREGGKFRITLGELLVGVALLAVPLAYWTSNVGGFRYRPLSPSLQKRLEANPRFASVIQRQNDFRNSNALQAYKITAYVTMACTALVFAIFLVVRRSGLIEG